MNHLAERVNWDGIRNSFHKPSITEHAFNPQPLGDRDGGSELETSLVYSASSKTTKATKRNPVSKKQKQNKQKAGIVADAFNPSTLEAESDQCL